MRFRVLDLATGVEEAVGPTDARFGEGAGTYSPDGKLIAYRGFGLNETFQLFVVPADGSAEPRALTGFTPGGASHEFSPDGTKVMLNRFGNGTLLIDVESGAAETLPGSIEDPATWQRLAP